MFGEKFGKIVRDWRFWTSAVIISAGLGYFGAYVDLIPDLTPMVGYLDDVVIAVFGAALIYNVFTRSSHWGKRKR